MRAQLVGLGKVAEDGLLLGRDGTTAGVGDMVQARRLAWELAGYDGNRRGPITREHYRVLETREDGSMVVAPIVTVAAQDGVEVLGQRMTLPGSYVQADLTLGYAATVHAVEGLTVDTAHIVATPRTSANALYPAVTRGREANHLYVVTRTAEEDAAAGEVAEAVTRNPRAVLATILETSESERSATAWATDSAAEAVSVRTAAERLAAVAEVTVAERTTAWLDELTHSGELTIVQRRRLAAEDGGAKLGPILRRIEIAGHDPRAALAAALDGRSLDTAQQISNVIVHRLTAGRTFDPVGTGFADWAPATDDPGLAAQLAEITTAADTRRRQLGEQLADDPPAWALETFGPVPVDPPERAGWVERAAVVTGHRELVGHDDPTDILGPAPKPGQIEAYASWRAAWRATGQPDVDRHEQSLSDGQLRMRVRAYQRELPWAPRRVVNELAATIQAAAHHRQTAEVKTAAAAAASDPTERDRLTREAGDAAALADTLDGQVGPLRELDRRWVGWFAHTAGTRAGADRANTELATRHACDPAADDRVTATEWAAARAEAEHAEDPHREITEHDLTDPDTEHPVWIGTDRVEVDRAKAHVQPVETIDLRELAADEPAAGDEDTVRVPTAGEAADSTRRAVRALEEIRVRNAADAAREATDEDAQAARVTYWHTRDQHTRTESDGHDSGHADARV